MTKLEALEAMNKGKKVTHKSFTKEEWITKTYGYNYLLEDGVVCSFSEFWRWRTEPCWDNDWSIFEG